MNQNPYSEPGSEVAAPDAVASEVGQASVRPIGHGWRWYVSAWELFKPAWGMWLLTALVVLAIMLVAQIIPLIGPLVGTLIAPVLMAGIIHMANQAAAGKGVEIGEVFAGFRERTGPLVALGALNLVVTILFSAAIIGPMFASMDMSAMQGMNEAEMQQQMMNAGTTSMLTVLIALALLIPWLAAYWFAVPLIFLGQRGLGGALKESFFACFRNILPFLWFGVVYMVLAVVASIPVFLGWLVLIPVMMLTYYTSFRDVFMSE